MLYVVDHKEIFRLFGVSLASRSDIAYIAQSWVAPRPSCRVREAWSIPGCFDLAEKKRRAHSLPPPVRGNHPPNKKTTSR
jgi:hypothetical protein